MGRIAIALRALLGRLVRDLLLLFPLVVAIGALVLVSHGSLAKTTRFMKL